jgi:DNA polymerase-3 subunit delta
LLAAKQNIEKLKLLYQDKTLTLEDIQFALNDAGHYDVYLLLDTVLQAELQQLSKILAQLKAAGTEPTLLIWIFTKEIRTLAQLAQAKEQNTLSSDLWQSLGVWRSRQNLLLSHLKRFTFQDYLVLIQQLAKLDKILKGAITGNIWQEIELFLISLTDKNLRTLL